jgi:type IX secretion system PorP/SprF family membrane protein
MRIKYCIVFLLWFPFYKLIAQVDPSTTFFPWTQPYFNPGAMGDKENHLNFLGVMHQSFGMRDTIGTMTPNNPGSSTNPDPNNPGNSKRNSYGQQQVLLHIDSYIKKIKGAVGIMFLNDKNGYVENIGFGFGYASRFRVRGGKLGIGAQLGFLTKKIRGGGTDLNPNNNPDPTVEATKQTESMLDMDLNFGLHYKAPTWYMGVSGAKLLNTVRLSGSEVTSLRDARQIYCYGGYIWNLKTAVPWTVEPSALIGTDLATWHLNLMALARYNGILYFGLSYQLNNGVGVAMGAVPFYNSTNEYLRGLEVGIDYNFDTKKTGWTQGGSWGDLEILLRYGFNFYKDKPLTGYGSTRHLYKNQY